MNTVILTYVPETDLFTFLCLSILQLLKQYNFKCPKHIFSIKFKNQIKLLKKIVLFLSK